MSVGIEIHDGGLAHVTLSRAEAGNAIGLETAHGLREAAHACAREDVRAVLLDGEEGPSASAATSESSPGSPASPWRGTSSR